MLLRGEAVAGEIINVAGVNDPTGVQLKTDRMVSEPELLDGLPRNKFTLLLKHRPTIDEKAAPLFDLQLSGHTHKGQIFPFTLLSRMAYPMNAGVFHLPGGPTLRVSRGTGTWGPPIRFLSPPEVTVIELVRKAG
jgi:predicted MPP superfamily phosphohydrolase